MSGFFPRQPYLSIYVYVYVGVCEYIHIILFRIIFFSFTLKLYVVGYVIHEFNCRIIKACYKIICFSKQDLGLNRIENS